MVRHERSLSWPRWQAADLRGRRRCFAFRLLRRPASIQISRRFRPDDPMVDNGCERPDMPRYTGFCGEGQAAGRSGSAGALTRSRLRRKHNSRNRMAPCEARRVWYASLIPPGGRPHRPIRRSSANRAIELEARFRIFQLLGTRAELGLHAREWIPAPPTNRRLHRSEQRELDNIGGNGGCRRCGSTNPGTRGGSFIGDHQVPRSMGAPTRIYPHCARCSASQGGLLGAYRRGNSE